MSKIRAFVGSIIFSLYMTLSVMLFTLFYFCVCFLPYKKRAGLLRFWANITLSTLNFCCGIHYRVEGMENIPEKPCLIFSKHQSTLETIVLQTIFIPHVWILKRELFWIPFFGWSLALSKAIAINRSDGKNALRKVTEQGKQRLAEGYWVFIFPEGTRTRPGQKVKYKIGGAKLAQDSGSPILPIAHNSGSVWKKGQFVKNPGEVTFSIGSIIESEGKKTKQILLESEQWIEAESDRLVLEP